MQFVVLLMWLCVSNAVLLIPAIVAAETGHVLWAVVLAIGLPALRIANRHRGQRGYYLVGYNDGAGGDFTRGSRWLSRRDQPQWFRLLVVLEVVIVALLIASFTMQALNPG